MEKYYLTLSGQIWSILEGIFDTGKLVYETDFFHIREWNIEGYAILRGLVFTESQGLESIQPVSCVKNENGEELCKTDWQKYSILPMEAFHTMVMGVIALTSNTRYCTNDVYSVLHVGLGSGSILTYLEYIKPQWIHTVLEIFPEIIQAATKFGVHPKDNIDIINIDANAYFDNICQGNQFDIIIVDAFDVNDKMPKCSTEPQVIEPCLSDEGIITMNIIYLGTQDEYVLPIFDLVKSYRDRYKHVFLIESSKYHKILFAHNKKDSITDEDIFYRTEFLHRQCNLPLFTRGRGFLFDVDSHTEAELLEWLRAIHHYRLY